MLDILSITTPIYLAIAAGFLAARFGLFSKVEMRVLGRFVIHIALPALLFNALIQRRFDEILNGTYLAAYAAGSMLNLGLALLWARRLAANEPGARPYIAMGMTCSNSGFVGFPIMLLTLPSVAGVALALNMLVENVLLLPLLMSLAEHQEETGNGRLRAIGQSILRLRKNPLIIAIFAAFTLSLLELKLPAAVSRTIALFSQASSAVSLFVIGGTLYGLSAKGMRSKIIPITLGKLALHPLLVWLALTLAVLLGMPALPADLRTALLLTAALPIMSIYPILGMRHGHEGFCAAALLSTTTLSFFTLSGLLMFLGH
ncbi:MAG: AEC family transporter [Propionivibrio sp.]